MRAPVSGAREHASEARLGRTRRRYGIDGQHHLGEELGLS